MEEHIIARGKIFELVQTKQPDGRIFEVARRAPGVRVIIADKVNKKVLLTKEYRAELNDWDYRLPGGKVYDTLEEFDAARQNGHNMALAAEHKAIAESAEEAGVLIGGARLYKKSTLGATVEWDLFVMEATSWRPDETGQSLEVGEQIQADEWFAYDNAMQMVLNGKMQEDRVALILLQWLTNQ